MLQYFSTLLVRYTVTISHGWRSIVHKHSQQIARGEDRLPDLPAWPHRENLSRQEQYEVNVLHRDAATACLHQGVVCPTTLHGDSDMTNR